MSFEYDQYLADHISNVNKGLHWMLDNLELNQEEKGSLELAMLQFDHDESKYSTEEYDAYDKYFYGGNRSYQVVQDFNYAWLHHQHYSPHHWQYWVLINDKPGEDANGEPLRKPFSNIVALKMPQSYIFEMIADWWSFNWKDGNLFGIFSWYKAHKDYQIMHSETRDIVESILDKIWNKLIEQERAAGHTEEWFDKKMKNVQELERLYKKVITKDISPVNELWEPSNKEPSTAIGHSDISEDEEDKHKYGVPEQKKFPLPDKDHVISAIRFFNYVDPKYEKELAEAILERAKEYGVVFGKDITVGEDNKFKKYLPEEEKDSQK